MRPRIFIAVVVALTIAGPAFAQCDDACGSISKILQARSGNFSKLKGKPGLDPRGDPVWEGTQAISGLIESCYVYKRGEGSRFLSHYEYHCEAPGYAAKTSLTLEKAKQIADGLKSAVQDADPKIVWLEDPEAGRLADIDGFAGTQGWYGGDAKHNVTLKVEVIVSSAAGSTAGVTIFAKPLVRRDLK
jgi:hypothetical protein